MSGLGSLSSLGPLSMLFAVPFLAAGITYTIVRAVGLDHGEGVLWALIVFGIALVLVLATLVGVWLRKKVKAGKLEEGLAGGGYDQKGEIDPRRSREHVLDEPLVARHVDDAQAVVAEVQVREAEVDADPASFLFLEPIGVDAGERPDQLGLAVVDVAGGPQDELAMSHRPGMMLGNVSYVRHSGHPFIRMNG